ncbi:hypothetical protein LPJ66_011397, partial [Kickxella alabastrina]
SSGGSGGKGVSGSSSGSKGVSGSSSSKVNTGTSTSTKGGGGTTGKGTGSLGDKPPSYASLYPDRSGTSISARPIGTGDSSRAYNPPPAYSANANYMSINRGQTLPPYSFSSSSPAVYYASTSRSVYPGAWGYGFYPIYPYPYWAYGSGSWTGGSYYTSHYNHGLNRYSSELRNTTVLNGTNIPLIGDQDIFNTDNKNITFTDFNNGTIEIQPCGNWSSSDLQVKDSDCGFIVLDLRNGAVVQGNARAEVRDEITFFQLSLGNKTSTLRTQTISSTKKSVKAGPVAGIVVGV